MIYVFDSNSLIKLGAFFPTRFPSLWKQVDDMVAAGTLVSVREVFRELDTYAEDDALLDWANRNKHIFMPAVPEESLFVGKIFSVPHFRTLINKQSMLEGRPVADPFIVASAKRFSGTVITEERLKP